MARIIYQEQEHVVPDVEVRGDRLFETLQVPPGHSLVRVQPDCNQLVHRQAKVQPRDGDYFLDAPFFEYGATQL